jgi:NAD(P)-dependent dehydrogenase (short-subunit alcohol dehydrogenase family)
MRLGLEGRRAIVTGASKGIGAATSRALAAEGAQVALIARDGDALAAVAGSIGNAASIAVGDLASAEGVRETIEQCTANLGASTSSSTTPAPHAWGASMTLTTPTGKRRSR